MRLKNKVAIITGAAKGIAKGMAFRFAREGAGVVLADLDKDSIDRNAADIEISGGQALAVQMNVTDRAAIQKAVNAAVERFGKLDIMANIAGFTQDSPSEDLPAEDWLKILDVNLNGVFYCCQAAARQMIKQGHGGKILNMSSGYGLVAAPQRAGYCTTKAGVVMLTKVLAIEWAKHQINVNALAPGVTRTELIQNLIDAGKLNVDALKKRTPLGRLGEVEDQLGAAVLMVSDEASFMTGEVVCIDGGWTSYGFI
jgi:NAD(P)-dependent dehydrogenase (short-subunit alcohol dehydrogenase family)